MFADTPPYVTGSGEQHRPRRRRVWTPILAATATLLVAFTLRSSGDGTARALAVRSHIGATTVFTHVPAPGHPFGIAVDTDRVYVSTSDGDFFAPHANSLGERVLAYNLDGKLLHTTKIATLPGATMGLNDIALDGNSAPNRGLYVTDMNGRVLRVPLDDPGAEPTVFSQAPFPFSYGNWGASMWNDITFDPAGNLYMTDDKPRIWRITPDGHASIWFQDARLLGLFGFAGGGLGGRIDPSGKYLYFADTVSARYPGESVVYRLPLVDQPSALDLHIIHRFALKPGEIPGQTSPDATGIAFAQSGDIYVALTGRNEIAVLDPAGKLIRTISNPLFNSPWGLAFHGNSLLVTNAEIQPVEDPSSWLVLDVYVGESGLPLNRPMTRVPVGR